MNVQTELTCPLCGAMFRTELPERMREGESADIECPSCGEEFSFECEEDYGEAA